jgi:nucleotide-binding universal stress UspA family protein
MVSRQLNAQLRGLIIGLFMPVFFTLVGLTIDLAALAQPRFLWLTLGLIALASVGKFLGAFLGGRFGGLTHSESFAVGCGMNARGSTEVIVASIGLQVGALTLQLFTAIVAMAVVTTMAMPPMLRWAFSRLPLSDAERARLEREDFEARGFLPHVDRLLVAVDSSPSGHLASSVAGLLAAARRTPTTVLQLEARRPEDDAQRADSAERSGELVKAAAAARAEAAGVAPTASAPEDVDVRTRSGTRESAATAIANEAHKGYGLLMIGCEPAAVEDGFAPQLTRTVAGFPGPFAIAIARGKHRRSPMGRLHVLVTVNGTRVSRQGAEVAIALAHASRGSVTALHVSTARGAGPVWRLRFGDALTPRGYPNAVIREIVEMGEHYGVEVRGEIRHAATARNALLRELAREQHDLLVMGVSPRPAEQLFLGELAAEMLRRAGSSLLFVCGEAPPGAAA